MPRARSAEVDLCRLCEAVRASRRALEPFRRGRVEAVRRYAGPHWSYETAHQPRPVNFVSLYVSVVARALMARDPRVLLDTPVRQHKPVAKALEAWANRAFPRMRLGETLQRVAVDALFSVGITKVALATPGEAERLGWGQEYGAPYACRVDLDDFVYDTHARDFREAAFVGHRVRVPLASVRGSNIYDAAERKKAQAARDRQYNEDGDERVGMLGRGYVADDEVEAYDMIDLWELYLPRERLVVTLLADEGGTPRASDYRGGDAPFAQRPWVGPDSGPYHFLAFLGVPGNAMPKGPIQDILDLDEHLAGLTQKLIDQAARQKELTAFGAAAEGDVQRIADARDGQVVRVDNPDKLKPLAFGGPHPANQAFAIGLWDLLNKLSGNLELMGGLSAQSKTATQDRMLNENSARQVQDMQQATVAHAADVGRALVWFAHHHPTKVTTGYTDVPGVGPVPRVTTPERRRAVPFDALDVSVDPYSTRHQTPQDRLQFLTGIVTQVVTPLLPLLQQQGIYFDVSKFLELVGEYGDCPDMADIVRIAPPPDPAGGASGDAGAPSGDVRPRMPVKTERSYNRVSSSEATEPGQNKAIRQALLGRNPGGNSGTGNMNGAYKGAGR